MYKVLIAEQSEHFRGRVISLINWEQNGCRIVGEASDGEQGILLCTSLMPDIVILDTLLPGISGLEMTGMIREKSPNTQFIVITSERLFARIRQAMRCGVQSWILKSELREDILLSELGRAKEQLRKSCMLAFYSNASSLKLFLTQGRRNAATAGLLRRQQIQLLCAPAIQQTSLEYMDDFDYWFEMNQYFHEYKDIISVVFSDLYGMKNLLLLQASDLRSVQHIREYGMAFAQEFQKYHKQKYDFDLHIALGGLCADEKQFYDTYLRSRLSLMDGVFNQNPAIVETQIESIDAVAEETAQRYLRQMKDLVIERRYEDAKVPAESLMNHLKMVRYPPLFKEIMLSAEQFLGDYAKQGGLIYPYSTINQAMKALLTTLDNMEREQSSKYSRHVQKMLQYIHRNYQTDINLDILAGEAGISPVYAGQLFKKELGKSVSQYLAECRISKAARLLESDRYKVYEVSELVGYTSVPYFNRIFRQYMGKSPSEMQKKTD